jgi:hypothetical protein
MNANAPLIVAPSPTLLPDFGATRRNPTRPVEYRDEKFDDQFDSETLLFDAFWTAPGKAALLAPPFLNLASAVASTQFFAMGERCQARVRHLERHTQIWLRTPPGAERLTCEGPLGAFEIVPGKNLADLFAGRRALLTLSKNNSLTWILDWVRYHRDVHGADAVLFYDNASTDYDAEDLARSLGSLDGIAQTVVVPWPFKYGPQGIDAWRFWDSDFCQRGAWEHARWRFLAEARSVMVGDIDELVVSRNGMTAFETAERSWSGLARYYGRWVIGGSTAERSDESAPRHRDFDIVLRPKMERSRLLLKRDSLRCMPKWTLVPGRCPPGAQWKVHSIAGWPASLTSTPSLGFRHFRELTNNWKYQRASGEPFDPALHEIDADLRAAMNTVDWLR